MPPVELLTTVSKRSEMSRDEIIAFELAEDFICYRVDPTRKPVSKCGALLRRLTEEIEVRHELVLKNMCERLNVQASTAELTFKLIADEMFADGVNWGRIVVLYTFGGRIATHCRDHKINVAKEDIIRWVGEYVCSLKSWIVKAGGWVNIFCIFLKHF